MSSTKPPTLADLDALPPGIVGEIIEGVLYTMTKPRMRHQLLGLDGELLGPFGKGRGGPGGWWIVTEPGIELPNSPEISSDVAGWRRERMPELPVDESIRVVPDGVCEIPINAAFAWGRTIAPPSLLAVSKSGRRGERPTSPRPSRPRGRRGERWASRPRGRRGERPASRRSSRAASKRWRRCSRAEARSA